ncbi:hypothetical protein BASA60_011143 [Batrachochytrium salamandrivorans]|nr:hypothetical protein BASA60_011143 [Batrachochytrium salamandrivorans]
MAPEPSCRQPHPTAQCSLKLTVVDSCPGRNGGPLQQRTQILPTLPASVYGPKSTFKARIQRRSATDSSRLFMGQVLSRLYLTTISRLSLAYRVSSRRVIATMYLLAWCPLHWGGPRPIPRLNGLSSRPCLVTFSGQAER